MADDVEMTPITPEEGGSVPPKVAPFGAKPAAPAAAPASTAAGSTIKLKPMIRKPTIHKPTIGAKQPLAAAVKPAPAAAPAEPAAKSLKSVSGPIPVAATLKKTGIIAEGIITPEQQKAAKSKTSRISLESAIGVAPTQENAAAPMKTIRLRRPVDLKAPAGAAPLTPLQPAAAPVPPAAEPAAAPAAEDASATQKKTLKLHRPATISRPTMGVAPAGGSVAEMGGGEVKPLAPMDFGAVSSSGSSGVPSWVAALSLVVTLVALAAVGLTMYFLWTEGVGPIAGANEMPFFQM